MRALLLNGAVSPSAAGAKNPLLLLRRSPKQHDPTRCRATKRTASGGTASPPPAWVGEYDLYELLGVERSSGAEEIKAAYRALQKRCHPDVAGPAGHDMAIILNEVYSLLSDPAARFAYDQEQAKLSEFQGYTGKPLYSAWFGSEAEERAVFVDEVKCVGCLKCALLSSKTFAIESVYGRARVVAQWADSEEKILDAIQTCPVDCISFVERSNLAALEFLMSKQPRGNVRMSEGNTVGARVSNIFADVDKFQSRFHEMKKKASGRESKESDTLRESRTSAVHGIRSISSWWYWRPFDPPTVRAETSLSLTRSLGTATQPITERLQEAAARRKAETFGPASASASAVRCERNEEYWTPMHILPPPSTSPEMRSYSLEPQPGVVLKGTDASSPKVTGVKQKERIIDIKGPLVMAVLSAAIVGSRGGDIAGNGLNQHIGGAMVLQMVNSFELQVLLAGTTWFVIGTVIAGLVRALGSRWEE